jgi:hypothetical protein
LAEGWNQHGTWLTDYGHAKVPSHPVRDDISDGALNHREETQNGPPFLPSQHVSTDEITWHMPIIIGGKAFARESR